VQILLVGYLACFNLLAFLLMYADKRFAIRKMRRIPESVLWMSAVLGGSIGAITGMRVFHHKTRKKRFSIGMPLVLIAQLGIAVWIATSL
jgi:uncharacterized membrane protein YsdA (DUF1294 family)